MNPEQLKNISAQLEAARVQAEGIKSKLAGMSNTQTSVQNTPQASAFTNEVLKRLESSIGSSSSADADILRRFEKARQDISAGATASSAVIESKYNREIGYQATENKQAMDSYLESRVGFATNTALLRDIQEQGDKAINDLEQRKQELILQGNAAAAGQLADLQLKEAEFMVDSRQRVISNLVSAASVGFQADAAEMDRKRFAFEERQYNEQSQNEIYKIGLQYGVDVQAGDTMQAVVSKASPDQRERIQLELDALRQSIANQKAERQLTNARIAEIQRGVGGSIDLNNPTDVNAAAQSYRRTGPDFLANFDQDARATIVNQAALLDKVEGMTFGRTSKESGQSFDEARNSYIQELASHGYPSQSVRDALAGFESGYNDAQVIRTSRPAYTFGAFSGSSLLSGLSGKTPEQLQKATEIRKQLVDVKAQLRTEATKKYNGQTYSQSKIDSLTKQVKTLESSF